MSLGKKLNRKPEEPKPAPKCNVCGDRALVLRSYVEPLCGAKEGRDLVRCPKCVK